MTAAARRVAGDRAEVSTEDDGGWRTVEVSRDIGTSWLSFHVSASSTAWVEQ